MLGLYELNPVSYARALVQSNDDSAAGATNAFIQYSVAANHFYDIINDFQDDPDWLIMKLKASQTGILTQKELDEHASAAWIDVRVGGSRANEQ